MRLHCVDPVALPGAAGLVVLGRRRVVPATGAWTVIGGNLGWAGACAILLFGTWVDPNAWGVAFVLVQIVAVLAFAELQAMTLRASR